MKHGLTCTSSLQERFAKSNQHAVAENNHVTATYTAMHHHKLQNITKAIRLARYIPDVAGFQFGSRDLPTRRKKKTRLIDI